MDNKNSQDRDSGVLSRISTDMCRGENVAKKKRKVRYNSLEKKKRYFFFFFFPLNDRYDERFPRRRSARYSLSRVIFFYSRRDASVFFFPTMCRLLFHHVLDFLRHRGFIDCRIGALRGSGVVRIGLTTSAE